MSIDVVSEIWTEIKRYIPNIDRGEASEVLIDVLIGQGHDVMEIKDAFKDDSDVKKALSAYRDDVSQEEDYDDEDDEDREGHNW